MKSKKALGRENRQQAYRRGRWAEKVAAWYLRLMGYQIVFRRFSSPVGEIDLIALKSGVLVFVEVKARKSQREALEAISARQWQRIGRSAQSFIQKYQRFQPLTMRFDAIFISPWHWPRHLTDVWRQD